MCSLPQEPESPLDRFPSWVVAIGPSGVFAGRPPPPHVEQQGGGLGLPHAPTFCQTVGQGPDSVLCAPADKLSRCQRRGFASAGNQSATTKAGFWDENSLFTQILNPGRVQWLWYFSLWLFWRLFASSLCRSSA